jgi:hypothetical protein
VSQYARGNEVLDTRISLAATPVKRVAKIRISTHLHKYYSFLNFFHSLLATGLASRASV